MFDREKSLKLMVSNIFIDKQKRLTIVVKPGLEDLFSDHVLQRSNKPNKAYETLFDFIENSNFSLTRNFVHRYITFFNPQSQAIENLTKRQKILYGLDEDENGLFLPR